MLRRICCTLALLPALAAVAVAAPSGLNTIPTADILTAGVLSIETETAGACGLWSGRTDRLHLLQIGLGKGMEAGLDRSDPGGQWSANVKWGLAQTARRPALAFGVQALGKSLSPEPYVCASRTAGRTRLHFGAIRSGSSIRCLAGVDLALTDRVTIQCDHISGGPGALSAGVSIAITPSVCVTLARCWANSSADGCSHLVNVACSFPIPLRLP